MQQDIPKMVHSPGYLAPIAWGDGRQGRLRGQHRAEWIIFASLIKRGLQGAPVGLRERHTRIRS
jgi:hypothetical protein